MKKDVYEPVDRIYQPRVQKALIEICLSCNLPWQKCKPDVCKRYKAMKAKILKENNALNESKTNDNAKVGESIKGKENER